MPDHTERELDQLRDKLKDLNKEREFYLSMARRSELKSRYEYYADVANDQIAKIKQQIFELGGRDE